MVRIHSPRPFILFSFIRLPRLEVLDSLARLRNCAQNCAHSGLLALAPLHRERCGLGDERSAAS